MKRFAGLLLALLLVFSLSSALAQRVSCPVGGFSVSLPDDYAEGSLSGDPDLCFYWYGNGLTVLAYASYQGEVAEIPEVYTGNETETGYRSIGGMNMRYTRSEEGGMIDVSYTWMDRGNSVTMEFIFSDPALQGTVESIISSIRFDAGH